MGLGNKHNGELHQQYAISGAELSAFKRELRSLSTHSDSDIAMLGPLLADNLEYVRNLPIARLLKAISEIINEHPGNSCKSSRSAIPAVLKLAVPDTPEGDAFGEVAAEAWTASLPKLATRLEPKIKLPKLPHLEILEGLENFAKECCPELLNHQNWRDSQALFSKLGSIRDSVPAKHNFDFEFAYAQLAKLRIEDLWAAVKDHLEDTHYSSAGSAVMVICEGLYRLSEKRGFPDAFRGLHQVQRDCRPSAKEGVDEIVKITTIFKKMLTPKGKAHKAEF